LTGLPPSHLLTATGRLVDIVHPDPAAVDIRDIAHSLSRLCRWGGHVSMPGIPHYSVAQHSLMVCQHVPPALELVGLLHDATEAYLGDVIGPLKALLPAYVELESRWALAIGERFGLGKQLAELPAEVKEADRRALATERRDLIAGSSKLPQEAEPYAFKLGYLAVEFAQDAFLNRFDRLGGVR
jgi:uncharacterized protein